MHNPRLHLLAAAVFVSFGASVALACGISFPWQLLDDRAATLNVMPVNNSFASEVVHLAPPSQDGLMASDSPPGSYKEALANAEANDLTSEQFGIVQQMRTETSGDQAYIQGASLPAAIRLYTAGAVDFHNGNMSKAIERFRAVLDLPDNAGADRAVWAAYMLGRIYSRSGDAVEATKEFALTRAIVSKGLSDPLGVAVASYGEEARLHLERARACQKGQQMSPEQKETYGREFAAVVALYAEQAAHGSTSGVDSLRIVANEITEDPQSLSAAVSDPMVQRLVIDQAIAGGPYDSASISQVVAAMEKRGAGHLEQADKLAALAYYSGDYHLAERVVEQATGPLASWVRARLAMQKGNIAEAAKYYAQASKEFPAAGSANASDQENQALLVGESGVLALSRGEYVDALEQIYPYVATYWGDVAYIAERVLTIDELKAFVDTHENTELKPAVNLNAERSDQPVDWFWQANQNPAHELRKLLGRRLVRAGRYQEAIKYLPEERNDVTEYMKALEGVNSSKSPVERARAWYQAAGLIGDYESGMELMGYECSPDYHTPGAGQSELGDKDPFVSDGERQRFEASVAKPDLSAHFLFIAVDQAVHAADLLPPRSQAFAAVLCNATEWVIGRGSCAVSASTLRASPATYQLLTTPASSFSTRMGSRDMREELTCELYQRYLKEGAEISLAKHFGRHCPEPDFDTALHFARVVELQDAHRQSRIVRHRWTLAIGVALALAIGSIPGTLLWFIRYRSGRSV